MPIPLLGRSADPPVVAIVGGGFSGLLTAIHLLRAHATVQVRLIERSAIAGPGRAYGAANPDHLLNVRSANMSAFPDQPDHFLTWRGGRDGDAFMRRSDYGAYLQDLLDEELRDPDRGARLVRERGEAMTATRVGGGWRVGLRDGRSLRADAVVLAVGFLPSALPVGIDADDLPGDLCVIDPWSRDLASLPQGDILLVGTGLTMVDVALALAAPGRRLTAVSRRGLAPLSHAPTPPAAPPLGSLDTPAHALRTLRAHAAEVGWRAAVDSIRPVTASVWRSWSLAERRRFLRRLRPWWDIHRHRMAPAVAEKLQGLQARGQLTVEAGKVERLWRLGPMVEAWIRPRGDRQPQPRLFAAVVNCASPEGDPDRAPEGLVADLRRQGRLRPDRLGLGLDIDDDFRAIGADGRASHDLFVVGPLTRGAAWEAIAVPDLRNQTAQAARAVLASLRRIQVEQPDEARQALAERL
jgi:uncharacterized NAD(P)/FAD-binding protein YdhS